MTADPAPLSDAEADRLAAIAGLRAEVLVRDGETEQLDLLAPDVAERLDEVDLLRLRIAELEQETVRLRQHAEEQVHRREQAETSRDHWITIAGEKGIQPGRTQHLVDPLDQMRQSSRDADYARHLLTERDSEVILGRQLAESLAHFARLVPKLPCPVKALPHDVAMALHWALLYRHHHDVLPQPKLPADQLAGIAKRYADHQAALGYSMRQVHGEATSGD